MDLFVQFKDNKHKKLIISLLLLLTLPLWLTILNYVFSFIIQAGRIIGTYIRLIESGAVCPF